MFTAAEKVRIRHHLCTRCGLTKAENEFHRASKNGGAKSGVRMPCKGCQRPTRAKAARQRRAASPEVRAAEAASLKRWLASNPNYEKERARRRYSTDPKYRARVRAGAKRFAREHPEYYRAAAKLRRARQRGVPGNVSPEEMTELFAEYVGLCAYCHGAATTIDHVVPISAGGPHVRDNLVPACKSCNSAKHGKSLLVFLARRKGCVSHGIHRC